MRLSLRQYALALLELEQELGEGKAKEAAKKFVAWLNRRGEGKKLGKIVAAAEKRIREQAGVVEVTITTAHAADVATRGVLQVRAEKIFAPKKVQASFVTDANLIGGVRMQSAEVLYDATLATSVRKLQASLVK